MYLMTRLNHSLSRLRVFICLFEVTFQFWLIFLIRVLFSDFFPYLRILIESCSSSMLWLLTHQTFSLHKEICVFTHIHLWVLLSLNLLLYVLFLKNTLTLFHSLLENMKKTLQLFEIFDVVLNEMGKILKALLDLHYSLCLIIFISRVRVIFLAFIAK